MSAATITADHLDIEGDTEISEAAIEALARFLVDEALKQQEVNDDRQ